MYAVVNIQGIQFKVEEGQKLYVNRLPQDTGESVEFGEVLLVDNEGAVAVGKPFVEGASVSAKVVDHVKSDKIIVFKKKRRKGYKVKNGHRQQMSRIEIESIKA
ncbi:MAG: 50S ribosomal protein L21 [Bacteroidia bacterium]